MAQDKSTDRRGFFKQSKEELSSQITQYVGQGPLDFLNKFVSEITGTRQAAPNSLEPHGAVYRYRRVLREGEPINRQGQPFGGIITAVNGILAPAALPGRRILVIVGHGLWPKLGQEMGRCRAGVSILEFIKDGTSWVHDASSTQNRRWDMTSPVPIEGAIMEPDKPAHWHRGMTGGMGPVACIAALPWQTFLIGERDAEAGIGWGWGWIVEINPVTGTAVKRFSLGRVGAVAIEPVCMPGRPSVVYSLSSNGHLFKFVTLQRFDSQRQDANATALTLGTAFVADLEKGQWKKLFESFDPEGWDAAMKEPLRGLGEGFLKPERLVWDRRKAELSIYHAGAVSVLKEDAEFVDEAQVFGYRLEQPGAVRTDDVADPAAQAAALMRDETGQIFKLPRGETIFAEAPDAPNNGDGLASLCIKELT